MTETLGNLWEIPTDYRCITTNGFVKRNGEAVMGKGCAAEAKQRYPGLPRMLGELLISVGNRMHYFPMYDNLLTYPVKHKWFESANFALIMKSADELAAFSQLMGQPRILLPRPGCGNGNLRWEDVKPMIANLLPDNVTIVSWGP